MPSITINFSAEKGQAVLSAFDAQGITDPDQIPNQVVRLKAGLVRLARIAERQHRQSLAQIAVSQAMETVDSITEDDDIGE